MSIREVILENVVGSSVGNRPESERRLRRRRIGKPMIVQAREVREFLASDHESSLKIDNNMYQMMDQF